MVIKGRPCKVTHVDISKTGKHGHAKCHFYATDIFTKKQFEDLIPASHTTSVPFVEKWVYQVIVTDEDEMTVEAMTAAGDTMTIKVEGTADVRELWVRHHPPPSAVSLRACPPPSLPTPPPTHTRLDSADPEAARLASRIRSRCSMTRVSNST